MNRTSTSFVMSVRRTVLTLRAPQIGCALFVLFAVGCDVALPGKPNPADRPTTPAERKDFAGLFAQNCSGCHGADGKLGPAPPLNDPIFLAIVPKEALLEVIANGRAGTPMPAFSKKQSGALTDDQIKIIAEGLTQHFKDGKKPPGDLPSYASAAQKEPPADEAVKRGEAQFAKVCATCHNGEDDSPGRLDSPALLALFSDQALRRIIITGRPDLGMPDFADGAGRGDDFHPLTSQEIDDLVAWLTHMRSAKAPLANGHFSNLNFTNRFLVDHPGAQHGF